MGMNELYEDNDRTMMDVVCELPEYDEKQFDSQYIIASNAINEWVENEYNKWEKDILTIIPKDKIPQGENIAKSAAQQIYEQGLKNQDKTQKKIKEVVEEIQKMNPDFAGMEEVAAMLALPDDQFAILAPIFLSELEKSYREVNNQMEMVQMMNTLGFKSEDIQNEYLSVCAAIDSQYIEVLSAPKRDFLKRMLGITYNALAEAEGITKRHVIIPIEFIEENAKMPAYAHLNDAGMDVFALEEITIAPGETKLIPLGIKVALPMGYELQVRPKSGRCLKTKLRVANTPGTIDAGYRDEICVIIDNIEPFIKAADIDENGSLYNVKFGSSYTIGKGEKFAQLVLSEVPKALFHQVENVYDIPNDGRAGGFGSTGLN
jgi:dUTP pyrophosphatase